MSLKYCPSNKVWADMLMKPMQGKAFREMRAELMNCDFDYTDDMMDYVIDSGFQRLKGNVTETASFKQEGSSLQECVGRSQKSVMKLNWCPTGHQTKAERKISDRKVKEG